MGRKLDADEIRSLLMAKINEIDNQTRIMSNFSLGLGIDPDLRQDGLLHDAYIYKKALADFRDLLKREERKKGV